MTTDWQSLIELAQVLQDDKSSRRLSITLLVDDADRWCARLDYRHADGEEETLSIGRGSTIDTALVKLRDKLVEQGRKTIEKMRSATDALSAIVEASPDRRRS